MPTSKVALRAYQSSDGRCIHYAVACLRKASASSIGATFINIDAEIIGQVKTCWILFYPAGPNRRLLQLVLARYAPNFDCDKDVLFLCINRPGKGGTSSSNSCSQGIDASPEQVHVSTACRDVATIMDYYQIPKASLFYMCAGSTFAFSFATEFPERCTGYIIGVSSWILRPSAPINTDDEVKNKNGLPPIHSRLHQMVMNGFFGPKWLVASIANGSMSKMNGLFGVLPASFVVNRFKVTLSVDEKKEFDKQFADRDGVGFVEALMYMNKDGTDGEGSKLIDSENAGNQNAFPNNNDGNAMDVSVCLSAQNELGLIYKTTIPTQRKVLIWHGTNDHMISLAGSEYLASSIPNTELNIVMEGTHQGTMFFFPLDVMNSLNEISTAAK